EDTLGIGEDDLAGGRERDTAVAAIEQAGVVLLFQLLDLEGHRRLRHEKVFRGPGEGAVLGHCVENLKPAICHDSDKKGLCPSLNHKSWAASASASAIRAAGHHPASGFVI